MAHHVKRTVEVLLSKRGLWHKSLKGRRRYRLIAVLLLVLIFGVGFLGISDFSSEANAPVTLAVAATISGSHAPTGQDALNGVQLAINNPNQNGGVNGHQIHLQLFNDKYDVPTARKVAQQ